MSTETTPETAQQSISLRNVDWNKFGVEYTKQVQSGKTAKEIAAHFGISKAELNARTTRLRKMLKPLGIELPKINKRVKKNDLTSLANELRGLLGMTDEGDEDEEGDDEGEGEAQEGETAAEATSEATAENAPEQEPAQQGNRRGRRG